MEQKWRDELISQLPYIAKPLQDIKSLYRLYNDKEYEEMLDKRATGAVEKFRINILEKAGAYYLSNNDEVSYENIKSELDKNYDLFKEAFMHRILMQDFTKSELYKYDEYRSFMEWIDVTKQYEKELEHQRAIKYKSSSKKIKEIIKETKN
jgi:uncharacterized protein (DUF1330 family)